MSLKPLTNGFLKTFKMRQVLIDGVRYIYSRRFSLPNGNGYYLGVSRTIIYNGKTREFNRDFHFYSRYPPPIEPGTTSAKEYPITFGRLNHLLESAIALREKIRRERGLVQLGTYQELSRMIEEGVNEREIILSGLEVRVNVNTENGIVQI